MTVKSLKHSSLTDNVFYRSMLAGNTAYNPSDEDVLDEIVLSSSAASVTFTGLGSYTDYKHLQLRCVARSGAADTQSELFVRVNSDSGTTYSSHYLRGNGSSVASGGYASQTYMRLGYLAANNNSAGIFSPFVMDVLDFNNSSKNSTFRNLCGVNGSNSFIFFNSGAWLNTNAITGLEILIQGNNLATGSRFTLIGLK